MNEQGRAFGDHAVLGIDNIRLELPLAGAGSRSLAAFVDYLAVWIVSLAWILLGMIMIPDTIPAWRIALISVGVFLIDYAYFAGFEIATGGKTPGKMALKLQVVSREGGTASRSSLLLRNLLRSIDLVVGVPLMAIDPRARRLGDRLGGTLVLHNRGAREEIVLGRVPETWGGEEVRLAEALISRLEDLEPDRATYLSRRVLRWIRRDAPELLEGANPGGRPVEALRQALAAERARAG